MSNDGKVESTIIQVPLFWSSACPSYFGEYIVYYIICNFLSFSIIKGKQLLGVQEFIQDDDKAKIVSGHHQLPFRTVNMTYAEDFSWSSEAGWDRLLNVGKSWGE